MAQKSPSSSSNAVAIGTGAAGQLIADSVKEGALAPILRHWDIIHMEPNNQSMLHNRERLKNLSQDISAAFRDSENTAHSGILQYYLGRMINLIKRADSLNLAQSQSWISNIGISSQIPELAAEMEKLLNDFSSDLATAANSRRVMMPFQTTALPQSSASGQPEERVVLLQSITDGGFVGKAIETAQTKLEMWFSEETPQVIGVYGMSGIGKTTLLRSVYNFYNVSNVFDVVIWLTVSRDYKIPDLQKRIGQQIGLDLSRTDDIDVRKMQLFANLKSKKFLLILDDLWRALDLKELGVAFETDKGSKVVFSTRDRDIALTEAHESMEVELLTREDGWLLFKRIAFKGSHAEGEIMECAKKIAEECQCLPLAITVVAKAMRAKKELAEWKKSLSQMKESSFPDIHGFVDKELYQKLRWSYEELAQTPKLQLCFLYCAMYPEDEKIWVDELVRIWIGEGFIEDMQLGHSYVKLLIDRGLFQSVNPEKQGMGILVNKPVNVWKKRFITVHDVIRDVAINIGEQQNSYLCRAGLQLSAFPRRAQHCQRVSVRCNQIESVREDILCTQLVSLFLSTNPLTCNVQGSFLNNLNSLRVLDLSNTQIESVPTSLPELTLLDLSNTKIKSVPTSFTRLQFLTLRGTCIKELPSQIGNLSDLNLTSLPEEISQLRSLRRLHLSMGMENAVTDPKNVMALKGLKNLTELHLYLFFKFEEHGIMGTIMGSWVEMRHLYLHYNHMIPSKSNLPEGMERMKNLQTLVLYDYRGTRLPNRICEFQQLERLVRTLRSFLYWGVCQV